MRYSNYYRFIAFLFALLVWSNIIADNKHDFAYEEMMVDSMRQIQYSNHVEALKIGLKLLNNSKTVIPYELRSHIYSTTANIFQHQGYFDLAEEYYLKAMDMHRAVGNYNSVGWLYVYLGNLYFQKELFSSAQNKYYKALDVFESINFNEGKSVAYNNLALIDIEQNKLTDAMTNFQKALSIRQKLNDSTLIAHSFVYIGELYYKQDSISKAIEYFKQVLLTRTLPYSLDIRGRCNQDMAMVYLLSGNDSLADYYFEQAEISFKKTNNTNFLIAFMEKRADLYTKMGYWQKSYAQLITALQVSSKDSLLDDQIAIYKKLLLIPPKFVPHYEASTLAWYKKLNELVSTLYKAEINNGGLLLNISEELSNYKTKIKLNESELSRAVLLRNTSITIVILLLMLLIILYIRFREKRKKNAIIAQQEELYFAQELYIKEVKTESIKLKLDAEQRQLLMKTTFIQQKNELIANFVKELKYQISLLDEKSTKGLNKLLRSIKNSAKTDNLFADFEKHFVELYPDFLNNLSHNYPKLSAKELKMCAYHKMNFHTKEIAHIAGITVRAVQTSRYRIRQKMNVPTGMNLVAFFNKDK